MNLLGALRGRRDTVIGDATAFAELLSLYGYAGYGMPAQTLAGGKAAEPIAPDFVGLAAAGFISNPVVFACMATRMRVFSGVRFQWQSMNKGRPSELFGTTELAVLERPWAGGTTQDLLARLIQDADLAGNSFWVLDGAELARLRPDWVEIVLTPRIIAGKQAGWKKVGYAYREGGGTITDATFLLPDEVAHFMPIPDPLASWRGMSWLTPVIREIQADRAMTKHREKFFTNGATPNMVVKFPQGVTPDMAKRFKAELDSGHRGAEKAYETLYLGGGADLTVVGSQFKQMEFTAIMGHGETRVASAAGVPAIIAGLSEGLAASTYSNFSQARRSFADGTMHPLWANAAGSLGQIVRLPGQGAQSTSARLWYDSSEVPFLREDAKDATDIQKAEAQTIRTLVDGGYTPDSVIKAVISGDFTLLEHSGLYSVQLQPAGAQNTGPHKALAGEELV